MPITIHAGDPGTVFTNDTGKILWQFVCSLSNSCGQCVQFHLQVGPYWPIPLHRGCRCANVPVPVGAEAHPFCDFRQVIAEASPTQRSRFVGATNLRLIESGTVAWGDVVTAGRIRTLAEVVGRQKLTVKQMVAGGLTEARARLAFTSAHPEEIETARRSAQSLAKMLQAQGLTPEAIHRATGERLAARVGIKTGPSGASGAGTATTRRPLPPLGPLTILRAIPAPTPADAPLGQPEARRLIVAAVGEDAAASIDDLPETVAEFDRLMVRLNGAVDHDALKAMMERLGIK